MVDKNEKSGGRRRTPLKKRGASTYERKADRIRKWYSKLAKRREFKGNKKEIKPLEFYLSKIKKASSSDKWGTQNA